MFGPSELLKMNGINSRSNDQPLALPSSVGSEGQMKITKNYIRQQLKKALRQACQEYIWAYDSDKNPYLEFLRIKNLVSKLDGQWREPRQPGKTGREE